MRINAMVALWIYVNNGVQPLPIVLLQHHLEYIYHFSRSKLHIKHVASRLVWEGSDQQRWFVLRLKQSLHNITKVHCFSRTWEEFPISFK